jgi:hypothetical protein
VTDERLRSLERATAAGDAEARQALIESRVRAGLCPWCGGPGAIHQFEDAEGNEFEAGCCCFECFGRYAAFDSATILRRLRDGATHLGGMCGGCPGAKKGDV